MDKIKVVIADDHSLMRQGVKQILELEKDIEVIGQAANGQEALDIIKLLNPDVVLLDINMPVLNGVKTLKTIKDGNYPCKVIMLTIHSDREYLIETINIGANGYMLKDAESDSLISAIRDVYAGKSYIHPSLASELVKEINNKKAPKKEVLGGILTERENEVLLLIAEGQSNKDIAQKLFISEKTVKNHVSNIFKKIEVSDRTQAAIYAFKNNLKELSC